MAKLIKGERGLRYITGSKKNGTLVGCRFFVPEQMPIGHFQAKKHLSIRCFLSVLCRLTEGSALGKAGERRRNQQLL